MFARVIFFALLLALWLLLSGRHTPLITMLGVASAAAVVWLGSRMEILGTKLHTFGFYLRLPWYAIWLLGRVAVACVRVTVTVLRPNLRIAPGFIRVPMTQKNDLGKLVHANSITLTPGTVSARVEEDHIEVHALDRTRAAAAEHAALDRKVSRLEGGG